MALARATIMRPNLLLADEPTGNLDTANRASIVLDLLDDLNDGGLTLDGRHPRRVAVARRADRILVLVDGRLEQAAAP